MALFRTDSLALSYSDLEQAKRWWIDAFECKAMKVPPNWDNQLPSDVALRLQGDHEPTILLSDRAEVERAGFDRSLAVVPVIFSDKLKKAHDHLSGRGVVVGPIQGEASPHFFEIRDIEGNVIEICEES
jgi:hypothetical protein